MTKKKGCAHVSMWNDDTIFCFQNTVTAPSIQHAGGVPDIARTSGGSPHVHGFRVCTCRGDRARSVLSVAWTCRDDKGLNGLLLSQNDLHLILRGFTHGGDPYDHFFLAVLIKNCHRNGHF